MDKAWMTGLAIGRGRALAQANRDFDEMAEQRDRLAKVNAALKKTLAERDAEIERLKLLLAVEAAHAEGLAEMAKVWAQEHPDSPLRADTGKRYKKNGNVKRRIQLHYEAKFDATLMAKAKELGIAIARPTDHRAD